MRPLIVLTLLFLTSGAFAQQTFRIDPDGAMGGSSSQLFDSVTYIPLESGKESLFGRVDKLVVTDHFFFILDHSTDVIVVFRKDGRFYSKISMEDLVKTPNRESLGLRDFMVNEATGSVLVSHWEKQQSLYEFDLHGKLKRIITDKLWWAFNCIDGAHYLMESGGDIVDSARHINGNCIITDTSTSVLEKSLLRHRELGDNLTLEEAITGGPGRSVFYTRTFDYSAYQIDTQGIANIYRFIFPQRYSLPVDFLDSAFMAKQADYLQKNDVVTGTSGVFRINNNLIFCLNKSQPPVRSTFMYSLKTGELYNLDLVTSDSTNGFVPISKIDDFHILDGDSTGFYTAVPAFEIGQYRDYAKDKHPVYSREIQAFFLRNNKNSNPVIVHITPRRL